MNARLDLRPTAPPDVQDRRRWTDWLTIWQSELAALAVDREMQEAAQRAIDLWAAHAAALLDDPARRAGPVPPPGSAPAMAASDREPDPADRDPADPGRG